jgi:hypothetical protein
MWCLDWDDLLDFGFALEWLKEEATTVDSEDPDYLHINILELITLIINIWLALVFITHDGNIAGGHIIAMLADNTSALSWLQYASQTNHPMVCKLTHFILDLTLSCPICHKLLGFDLQGILNIGVDKLSWFEPSATQGRWPHLGLCYSAVLPTRDLSSLPSPA